MVREGVGGHERSNAARFDMDVDVDIGPSSNRIRLESLASSPYLTQKPVLPPYSSALDSDAQKTLAARCSVEKTRQHTKSLVKDQALAQALRKRLLTWVDSANPGEGETIRNKRKRRKMEKEQRTRSNSAVDEEEHVQMSTSEQASFTLLEELERALPEPFRCVTFESVVRFTDKFPSFQAIPALASAYYRRDTRLEESAIQGSTPSDDLKTPNPKTSRSQGKVPVQEVSSLHPTPLVASISFYARQTRGMWSKERSHSMANSAALPSKGEEEEESATDMTQARAKKGAREGPYSSLQLAQQIEISTSSTLQQLRDAIVCRMDDFPEAGDTDDNVHPSSSEVPLRPYTGKKRVTDSCFLIEGKIYSEWKDMEGQPNYASLLSEFFSHHSEHPEGKFDEATSSGSTMANVRLDQLEVHANKLYWFLHQGSCEHLWAITSLRAMHRSPDISRSTVPPPITTFLSYGFMLRPLVRWARPKAKIDSYALDNCEICQGRHACVVVLGGVDFRPEQGKSTEKSSVEHRSTFSGLKDSNTSMCEICYDLIVGAPLPTLAEMVSRSGKNSASDMSDKPWAGSSGKGWTVVPALE